MAVRATATTAAVVLMSLASGCAGTSCPAAAYGEGIHVDATGWAAVDTITASVCLDGQCQKPVALHPTTPNDLFLFAALPAGSATVRVELQASDGRRLDVSTTVTAKPITLHGSGCGSTPEIDLAVDAAGQLMPGKPRDLNDPLPPRPAHTTTRPSGLPKP